MICIFIFKPGFDWMLAMLLAAGSNGLIVLTVSKKKIKKSHAKMTKGNDVLHPHNRTPAGKYDVSY